jgi:hypothetical protein
MFNTQIDNKFKGFIKHLTINGYKFSKENKLWLYQKNNIIVKIDSTNIIIKDNENNRRYYFDLDTSDTFLLNFLDFLTNNYSEALI